MLIRTDVCVCAWWLLVEEGSGIHTRPSIIMTGSRKYNPLPVTWLPAVLATRRRTIRGDDRERTCTGEYLHGYKL